MPNNLNTTNLIEKRLMILRNGVPYNSKAEAIATIKTSAFLAAPGGKAEGLLDGETILARYWAYYTRTTSSTDGTKFTEEFPTTATDMGEYTFVRELDETTADGKYKVIRVLLGVTTLYYDSSSQVTRKLDIFDNMDSINERFEAIEAEIQDVSIALTSTDATGTDATLLGTLELDADGRTLRKTIAKILGSNAIQVTAAPDTSATPDEKNITLSLKLKDNSLQQDKNGLSVHFSGTDSGLRTATDGLRVNVDNRTVRINGTNQVYVEHDTTMTDSNLGLGVNFDNTTIKQNSNNKLSVNYNEKSIFYSGTDGLGVRADGKTIKITSTDGVFANIDKSTLIYSGTEDKIKVHYDGTTIRYDNTKGLNVPYDNKSIKYSGTDGFYVKTKANGGITLSGTDGLYITPGDFISERGLEVIGSGTDVGKIGVKVDGTTVGFDDHGNLKVIDAMITDNFFGGQGITLETNSTDNTVTILADIYKGNDTFTSTDVATRDVLRFVNDNTTGTDNQVIAVKFGLKKFTSDLETNVKEAYQLVDAKGQTFGEQIKIYKDSSLVKVAMGLMSNDLVAAWKNGSTTYYTSQGTTAEPTTGSNTVTVYSDADCTTSVGVGTIADDNGTLILTLNSTEYLPSESDFTTKTGTGTGTQADDDALVFIYRMADGTYSLVAIDIESFLAENEFDRHYFDVSAEHIITVNLKNDGGLTTGTGEDYNGLYIKIKGGGGLSTTTDGLELNVATSTDLGGIKLFADGESTGTVDYYPVELDDNKKAYVNLADFNYHGGLTITGRPDGSSTDVPILSNWKPSADGSISITSDEFIKLTPSDGSIVIGLNTTTDIANTTSTDALVTVPTTQAVINYIDTASVIGEYTNPVYNTSTDNPSVMDPTILNNVVYGENSSTDADTLTVAINKIDNKLASVFNALLDYEALNASALESIRVNAGLGESFIYNPYPDSIISEADSLYEADVLLANRLLGVGTDIHNLQLQIDAMGTDIANIYSTLTDINTDIDNIYSTLTDFNDQIEYLKDNKLDEVIGGNGITVSSSTETSTDVYKQTIELDLAENMYTVGGVEIEGVPSNLRFYGSSTDGMKKLVLTNVWDCGVY